MNHNQTVPIHADYYEASVPTSASQQNFKDEEDVEKEVGTTNHQYKDSSALFVKTILDGKPIRNALLEENSKIIMNSVKSTDHYFKTVFTWRERALDRYIVPWLFVTFHGIVITVVYQERWATWDDSHDLKTIYSLALSSTLAFLLVFRLNRVAVRYWDTRQMWGLIIAESRILASAIITHANHEPDYRNQVLSWLVAYVISVKQHMRNEKISRDEISGFAEYIDFEKLYQFKGNPCLYCEAEIRGIITKIFSITDQTPISLSVSFSSMISDMEKSLNALISLMGGLERVRSTPLPAAYTVHLRTFLLIYLICLPYVYISTWGWATIPTVAITAFALLGIDGAASECERPFQKGRPNQLNMDMFCMVIFDNITDLVVQKIQT